MTVTIPWAVGGSSHPRPPPFRRPGWCRCRARRPGSPPPRRRRAGARGRAASNTTTTLMPTRCEPDDLREDAEHEGTEERGRLAGEREEPEELVLLVGRNEAAEQRSARRLIGPGEDADADPRHPEQRFRRRQHREQRRQDQPPQADRDRALAAQIRSSTQPSANAPAPAATLSAMPKIEDLLEGEAEGARRRRCRRTRRR